MLCGHFYSTFTDRHDLNNTAFTLDSGLMAQMIRYNTRLLKANYIKQLNSLGRRSGGGGGHAVIRSRSSEQEIMEHSGRSSLSGPPR